MPNAKSLLPDLTGPVKMTLSGAKARQLVVLLHGWGADGPNLIDLADVFAPALPDALFIAPNAPYPCEANPYGYQWFSLTDRQPQHMLDGMRNAADIFNQFLDQQLTSLGLDNSKLALVGFSQGTMVALHVALRRLPQIACVAGFSGALVGPDVLGKEIAARPPVCLIHGEMDDVVPFAAMKAAVDVMSMSGVKPETHKRPFLGHSIDLEGMKIASEFLKKNWG